MDVGVSQPTVDQVAPVEAPLDRARAIAELEKQLAMTPRAVYPYQYAGIAYRLGLAYSESVGNDQSAGLRKALAYYDLAASIFDPRYDPVPHARVLNAAGAAHRALGDRTRAADLFERAAVMLAGHGRDDERGAALNNLGLVRAELGQLEQAVEACDQALELFDDSSPDGRRARAASLHTRGMAHAAMGTEAGLVEALADYDRALTQVGPLEAPYHFGVVQHAAGVASIGLAELRPGQAGRLLQDARGALSESLTIFTRSGFPYQYALAQHNLGLALMRRALTAGRADSVDELRRSLACFEETVSMLDPRLYPAEWQMGYTNLDRVQNELTARGFSGTRADHFVALLASSAPEACMELLRERLTRVLAMPDPHRLSSLVELAAATGRLDYDAARMIIRTELGVLMELPGSDLQVGLEARYEAHRRLEEQYRDTANRALDQAIGDALGGPQRMFVRDFLYGLGWERP